MVTGRECMGNSSWQDVYFFALAWRYGGWSEPEPDGSFRECDLYDMNSSFSLTIANFQYHLNESKSSLAACPPRRRINASVPIELDYPSVLPTSPVPSHYLLCYLLRCLLHCSRVDPRVD